MNLVYRPRQFGFYAVGNIKMYLPVSGERDDFSDVVVVSDVERGNGSPTNDVVVGRRDLIPLPDGRVAFFYGNHIADYSDPGFDPATLQAFVYGRIVDEKALPSASGLIHLYVSEVIDVTGLALPALPAPGDLIGHVKQHTYIERDRYAFVRVAKPVQEEFDYGYFVRVEAAP